MRRSFVIGEDIRETAFLLRTAAGYALRHGDDTLPASLTPLGGTAYRLQLDGRAMDLHIARDGDDLFVQIGGRSFAVRLVEPLVELAQARAGGAANVATAPMPGMVVNVLVRPGQTVNKGQTMIVIESMKLETAISAWRDGTIEQVHVAPGQSFDRAAPLVTLAGE